MFGSIVVPLVLILSLSAAFPADRRMDSCIVSDSVDLAVRPPVDTDLDWLKKPPFSGTPWALRETIEPGDPTTFESLIYTGRGFHRTWVESISRYTVREFFTFRAKYDDLSQRTIIRVRAEWSLSEARKQALLLSESFGRVPVILRSPVREIHLHRGRGRARANLEQATFHMPSERWGPAWEEILIHEAAHIALDPKYERHSEWIQAQREDDGFISEYAQEHPFREDLAESITAYLAVKYRDARIGEPKEQQIRKAIPNRIRFLARNISNKQALPMEKLDSPPGSPTRLTAAAGNRSITLRWSKAADGGSSILRYEYRYKTGRENDSYGEWAEVSGGSGANRVTISGLTNGIEYAFQVRAVNDIGEGEPATVKQTPGAVPDAPSLSARGGNRAVTLRWNAPAHDGGARILSYDVRYRESGASWGAWTKVEGGATARTLTITGLTNGTFYEFQVRAVNGKGGGAEATTESTPMPGLDFAHFANGEQGGVTITSDIVLVNVETSTIYPAVFFYDQMGEQIAAGMVVDLIGDLMITEDGGVAPAMGLNGLGEITISTHGRGALVIGSAKVFSDGRIGGVLRFSLPSIGVAGVGASQSVPAAVFPARRQGGGINTGAAIRNLEPDPMTLTCQLMRKGAVLEEKEIPLPGNGQIAKFIDEMFETDTSDFVGVVRCSAPDEGRFTGVALEMDPGNRIFTTLPVIPVSR